MTAAENDDSDSSLASKISVKEWLGDWLEVQKRAALKVTRTTVRNPSVLKGAALAALVAIACSFLLKWTGANGWIRFSTLVWWCGVGLGLLTTGAAVARVCCCCGGSGGGGGGDDDDDDDDFSRVFGPAISPGVGSALIAALMEAAPAIEKASSADDEDPAAWDRIRDELLKSGSRLMRALRRAHSVQCAASYKSLMEQHPTSKIKDLVDDTTKLCLKLADFIYDVDSSRFIETLDKTGGKLFKTNCWPHMEKDDEDSDDDDEDEEEDPVQRRKKQRRRRPRRHGAPWAVVAQDDCVFVVFRGTASMIDVVFDLALDAVESDTYCGETDLFAVHAGFATALDYVKEDLFAAIDGAIEQKGAKRLVFTGHSLGGAYASLCCLRELNQDRNMDDVRCITFGAPRFIFVDEYDYVSIQKWETRKKKRKMKEGVESQQKEQEEGRNAKKDSKKEEEKKQKLNELDDVEVLKMVFDEDPILRKLHEVSTHFVLQGDVIPRLLGHSTEQLRRLFRLFGMEELPPTQGFIPVGKVHLMCEDDDSVITLSEPAQIAQAMGLGEGLPIIFAPLALMDHLGDNYLKAICRS